MKTVTLYTDGACSGNPGPGGWGCILEYNGVEKELSGGETYHTECQTQLHHRHRGVETFGHCRQRRQIHIGHQRAERRERAEKQVKKRD